MDPNTYASAIATIAKLEAQHEQDLLDAKRYRWLRVQNVVAVGDELFIARRDANGRFSCWTMSHADEAIDAEMAAKS